MSSARARPPLALCRLIRHNSTLPSSPLPLPKRREAIFLAGLPGSGKSRVIESRYGVLRPPEYNWGTLPSSSTSTAILDLDAEMLKHPGFDPAAPHRVYDVEGAYDWADERVEERFIECCLDASIARIVLDGTGTKVARRTQRMIDAKRHGLWVHLRKRAEQHTYTRTRHAHARCIIMAF